jgi:hypothetical protein
MSKAEIERSLRVALGASQQLPKRKPSKTIGEAIDRLHCEAERLEKVVRRSSDNSDTLASVLESLK